MSKKGKKLRVRWYYDACALEGEGTIYEIVNTRRYPKESVLSHLSLGEAYGNCFLGGKEKSEAFIELIEKLRRHITIIKNDGIDNQFEEVKAKIPALSITDAIHLATALKNDCSLIRTIDRDLYGIEKNKVHDLGKKFGIEEFSISNMGNK